MLVVASAALAMFPFEPRVYPDGVFTGAGVAPKFIDRVLDVCDEEMIGDVEGLYVAANAGVLDKIFKTTVALGISKACSVDISQAAASAQDLLTGKPTTPAAPGEQVDVPLNLLEFEPYHDVIGNLPLNTYKNKASLAAASSHTPQ